MPWGSFEHRLWAEIGSVCIKLFADVGIVFVGIMRAFVDQQ